MDLASSHKFAYIVISENPLVTLEKTTALVCTHLFSWATVNSHPLVTPTKNP